MNFRPKARDAAEALIVLRLRAEGASVERVESDARRGIPDLLVGFKGVTGLLEVKNPEATRSRRRKNGDARLGSAPPTSLSEAQERWHREWRGGKPAVVRTPEEAVEALHALVAGRKGCGGGCHGAPAPGTVLRAAQEASVGGGSWQAAEDTEEKRCAR